MTLSTYFLPLDQPNFDLSEAKKEIFNDCKKLRTHFLPPDLSK